MKNDRTGPPTIQTLAEVETEHMKLAIQLTAGNLTRAAEHLGISRKTIYRRIASDPELGNYVAERRWKKAA